VPLDAGRATGRVFVLVLIAVPALGFLARAGGSRSSPRVRQGGAVLHTLGRYARDVLAPQVVAWCSG
jgi:hypothetical protein